MDLDKRFKPCTTTTTTTTTAFLQFAHNCNERLLVDRLSSLPVEVLIHILSLLPTKDVAAVCVLSHRLRDVFPRITSIDIDSSPISFCLERPYKIEQFPSFVSFVDTVLHAHQSHYLTRFRLGVGLKFEVRQYMGCNPCQYGCEKGCYPDLLSTQIVSWISFPLTHCGLRELDLYIPVKEPGDGHQLPPEIFNCETLEVLKLDVDLFFDQVSNLPSFHLPNLKLLDLRASLLPNDGFLARLISSCPVLEDLTVEALWDQVQFINISSPSLRRLCFYVVKLGVCRDTPNTNFVLIHAPNLEYLEYNDDLPLQYSISNMECLVKAHIHISCKLRKRTLLEVYRQQMLTLIRPLSNVQHLVLGGISTHVLDFVEVMDQLPIFHNLKYLELKYSMNYWPKVLLAFLKCSPVLETLAFPQGMVSYGSLISCNTEQLLLEREFCRTLQTIPSCCAYYLKKILIRLCVGNEREMDLI